MIRAKHVPVAVAIAICIVIAAYHIATATGNIVYQDAWAYIPMVGRFLAHQMRWRDLWKPHNGYDREPIVKALFLVSAALDHLNIQHLKYLSIFPVLTVSIVVVRKGSRLGVTLLSQLIVVALLFSLGQWENWLEAINVAFFLVVMSAVLVVSALSDDSLSWWHTVAAIGASLLAGLSAVGGLIVWLIGLLAYADRLRTEVSQARPYVLRQAAAYTIAGMAFGLVYVHGTAGMGTMAYVLAHMGKTAVFFIIVLGNTVVGQIRNTAALIPAFVFGLLLLAGCGFVLRDYIRRGGHGTDLRFAVFLVVLGLVDSALIAYGRSAFPIDVAQSSRYATLSLPALVGAILYFDATRQTSLSVSFRPALMALTAFLLVVTTVYEMNQGIYRMQYTQNLIRVASSRDVPTNAELAPFGWNPDTIRASIPILRSDHLSFFYKGGPGSRHDSGTPNQ